MAFEKLEVRLPGKSNKPAAISLRARKDGGPSATVSLRSDLVAAAGYKGDTKFHVMMGSGEDAGKLRLVAEAGGIVPARVLPRTNAFFVTLGHVAAFGMTPCQKTGTHARVVGTGVVEIDIPDFAVAEDEAVDEVSAAAGGGAPKRPQGADAGQTVNGITIDLAEDNESVTFKGKSTEVTTRQAKLVRLLARPRPSTVGEAFLIGALWDGKPPKDAAEQLRQLAGDLQKGLSPIGLNLCAVKGVGYQLKDL